MRRLPALTAALFLCAATAAAPVTAAGGTTPAWSAPLALGPMDVGSLAAGEGLVVASGRQPMRALFGGGTEVLPGPRRAGLYGSDDGGRTWWLARRAGSNAILEAVPDVVAVAPAGGDAYATFGSAVWRSDDSAQTWRPVGDIGGTPALLEVLPGGRLIAGLATGGLRASDDRGESWSSSGSGLPSSRVNDVLYPGGNIVLVATDTGVYRSTDGGASFSLSATGLASSSAAALALAAAPSPANGLYVAVAATGLVGTAVYSTHDDGATWRARGPVYSQNLFPRVNPGAMVAGMVGNREAVYVGTPVGLLRADLPYPVVPLTWIRYDPEPGAAAVAALAVHDTDAGAARNDEVLAAVRQASVVVHSAGGIRLAAPGWIDGLEGGRVCGGLVVHRSGDLVAACGRHVLRSSDGGATWRPSGSGLPYVSAGIGDTPYWPLAQSRDGVLWTSGYAYGLYRSDTSGDNWRKVAIPAASVPIIVPDPRKTDVVYAAGLSTNGSSDYVLWRSSDAGANWRPVFAQPDPIYAVTVTPRGPHRVLVLTFRQGAWLSEDDGQTFTAVSGLPVDSNNHGHRAAFSAAADGVGYAVITALAGEAEWRLYRTADGGRTWSQTGRIGFPTTTGGFADVAPNDLAASPWHADTVYFETSTLGVVKTTDAGASFALHNTGLYGGYVDALTFDPGVPGRLYVANGHHGSGADAPTMWVLAGNDAAATGG